MTVNFTVHEPAVADDYDIVSNQTATDCIEGDAKNLYLNILRLLPVNMLL